MSAIALTEYLLGSVGFKKQANISPINTNVASNSTAKQKSTDYEAKDLKEFSMWQTWKNSNYNPNQLRPLKKSMQPIIRSHVRKWQAANVPKDLINMHAQQLTIEALKTYDPTIRGSNNRVAAVGSHVNNHLRRLQRFVVENQNAARIIENRAGKNLRFFQEAQNMLFEELKRDPTAQELAEKMTLNMGKSVSVKEARRFMSENRKDRATSDDNFSFMPTGTRMLMKLLPEELTPLENQVFERYYGLNGSPKKKPGVIAMELGLTGPRVSRILNKISDKANEYL